jgi:hypothetical protein
MSRNRTFLMGTVMALAVFCAMSVPAAAQFSVSITVDENGNGTFTNTNGFFSNLPFLQIHDPGPGGLNGVANYGTLNPPGLVGGDLVLLNDGLMSDLIRFDPVTGGGSLFFYSDLDGGVDALADIGMPTLLNTNVFRTPEVAIGGGRFGLIYTPTAGQPGFVAGAAGPVTYTIISDNAPEPASIVLMSSAVMLLFLLRRWRTSSVRS